MAYEAEIDKIIPNYITWLLKSRGLKIVKIEKFDEKIDPIKESVDIIKRRELEQIQVLLVGLTHKLANKIEEMNSTKEDSKVEKMNSTKEDSKVEKMNQIKEGSKFELADISWYRKQLDDIK